MYNTLQDYVKNGGLVTIQCGNYRFGIYNFKKILVFNNNGILEKSVNITNKQLNNIKCVDDIYDIAIGKIEKPDFIKALNI